MTLTNFQILTFSEQLQNYANRRAPHFSAFQHYHPEKGKEVLSKALTQYHTAQMRKNRYEPQKNPKTRTGDAEQDRLQFRPFLRNLTATKFGLQLLRSVKQTADAAMLTRSKKSTLQNDRRVRKRTKKRSTTHTDLTDLADLDLVTSWKKVRQAAEVARKGYAAEKRSAAQRPLNSESRLLDAEKHLEQVETTQNRSVRSLRWYSPGLSPDLLYAAWRTSKTQLENAIRKKSMSDERRKRLQEEVNYLRYLYETLLGKSKTSSSSHAALPAPPPFMTDRDRSSDVPGTPEIAALLDSMPATETSWQWSK